MHAAVVTAFDRPPRYADHPEPAATGQDEVVVEVLAAGLHPRVRSQAAGSHYTSTGTLPLVPGIDAVVRDPRGKVRYAVLDDTTLGTMADRTVIELDRSVVLPSDVDPVQLAAAMNPVMSSWVALRRRIRAKRGQRVLVLGADQIIGFDEAARAADVDVVIDYVWGEPSARAMVDLLTARDDRSAPLTWIQVGSVAGPTAPIPSAALRSARLDIVGSGIGSVPGRDFVKELPKLAAAVGGGGFDVRARALPLRDVEQAWELAATTSDRIVLVPLS